MSLQYRRFGERRYREGVALYAADRGHARLSAAHGADCDRDGDLLHAVASREDDRAGHRCGAFR